MDSFDGNLRQLSLRRNDEVQVLEAHVRAWDPADAVTIHPRPDVDVETRKKPLPGAPTVGVLDHLLTLALASWKNIEVFGLLPQCRCFEPPASKFISARLARMVCSEDTMIYTGSGGMSLRQVCCCSCYQH